MGLYLIKALSEILGVSAQQLENVPRLVLDPHNDQLRVFNGSESVDFKKDLQDDPLYILDFWLCLLTVANIVFITLL